jgi:hypothetical protein
MSMYSPAATFSDLVWTSAQSQPLNNTTTLVHNQLQAPSRLPPIRPHPVPPPAVPNNNRNGAIFTTQSNGWLTNSYNNGPSRSPQPCSFPYQHPSNDNNTYHQHPQPHQNNASLPRYFQYHQGQNASNSNSPANYSLRRPEHPPRIDPSGQTYFGYTRGAESRSFLISNDDSPDPIRPQSVISFRNNVAYITSTLPLSNSFTNGGRRNVRFGGTTTINLPNPNTCSGATGLNPNSEQRREGLTTNGGVGRANPLKSCNVAKIGNGLRNETGPPNGIGKRKLLFLFISFN